MASTTAAAPPTRAPGRTRRPAGMLPGLHITLRPAAAWYWCGICGHVLSCRGRQVVPNFVATVRTAHRALCPGRELPGGAP